MQYELAIVMPGGTTAAQKKSMQETIEKMVKVNEGKILEIDDWGKTDLAYEIKGNNAGYFMIFTLELNQQSAKAFLEKIRLEEGIIRHLFIKKQSVNKSNKPKSKLKKSSTKKTSTKKNNIENKKK